MAERFAEATTNTALAATQPAGGAGIADVRAILIIAGVSGSGKTTIATAPAPLRETPLACSDCNFALGRAADIADARSLIFWASTFAKDESQREQDIANQLVVGCVSPSRNCPKFFSLLKAGLRPDRPAHRFRQGEKQGQFRRKQRSLLQRVLVITMMIYGLKGRLAKQNNRKKTGSNFNPTTRS
jgi:hypothetical protein